MIAFIQRILLIPRLLSHFLHVRGKKNFVPLREAKSIGIIADLRKPGNLPPVVQFCKAIHRPERRCHVLIIVPDKRKEVNPFDYEKHFPGMPVELICQEEMTFFRAPKKEVCRPFTSAFFDIVFYLDTEDQFALQSVLWQSQSRMFAGPEGFCHGTLDFEIALKERTDLPYLADNLIKYLQTISNRHDSPKPQSDPSKLF